MGKIPEEIAATTSTSFRQFRQLKVGLLNQYPDLRHKVIMVASSVENEGCTTTAVSLAKALVSDDNVKVLLIDGNLRSPSLHRVFGLNGKNGLSKMLRGQNDIKRVIKKTGIDNLFVVTSGESAGLEDIKNFKLIYPLLDRFKSQFDFVVLDAPPVISDPDSISLSSKVDGVIFVMRAAKTRWEVAQEAIEQLRTAGAKILGGVLNKRKYYIPEAIYRRL
jgi:capsular exopolysaccharide synthesis family protein